MTNWIKYNNARLILSTLFVGIFHTLILRCECQADKQIKTEIIRQYWIQIIDLQGSFFLFIYRHNLNFTALLT